MVKCIYHSWNIVVRGQRGREGKTTTAVHKMEKYFYCVMLQRLKIRQLVYNFLNFSFFYSDNVNRYIRGKGREN